ncbi:response regulator [Telluribacter sp. SYSU D00476]|uniref:response regulator n=1 Tax=Telluribacter sp. SYSU D00476 TaxID=2811430 RepID=UPI001FF4273C|nr:response regulator [Telluribacter sp. SYSU D00476]
MINHVMVVDHDEISMFITKHKIIKTGFAKNIISMSKSTKALDYFEYVSSNPEGIIPELIFLDLSMPVMNGWEFVKLFTKHFLPLFPSTKICITSFLNPSEEVKAIVHPCVINFINKPLSLHVLEGLKDHELLRRYFMEVSVK